MPRLASRPDLPLPSCFSPLPLVAGTVDIGHLSHPVLMHLRAFFDLLDSFTVQAVQSGQPLISDHLMFEVCVGGKPCCSFSSFSPSY